MKTWQRAIMCPTAYYPVDPSMAIELSGATDPWNSDGCQALGQLVW